MFSFTTGESRYRLLKAHYWIRVVEYWEFTATRIDREATVWPAFPVHECELFKTKTLALPIISSIADIMRLANTRLFFSVFLVNVFPNKFWAIEIYWRLHFGRQKCPINFGDTNAQNVLLFEQKIRILINSLRYRRKISKYRNYSYRILFWKFHSCFYNLVFGDIDLRTNFFRVISTKCEMADMIEPVMQRNATWLERKVV